MPKLFIAICAVALLGAGCAGTNFAPTKESLEAMTDRCVEMDGFPFIKNDGYGDYLSACIFYPSVASTNK